MADTTVTIDEVQWDWTSHTAIPDLTTILSYLMPKTHPLVATTGAIEERKQQIRARVETISEGSQDVHLRVIFCGSYEENLALPEVKKRGSDSDFEKLQDCDMDMIIEAVQTNVGEDRACERRIDIDCDTHPGYLRLISTADSTTNHSTLVRDGKVYLSRSKTNENFSENLCNVNTDATTSTQITESTLNTTAPSTLADLGTTVAFPCPKWPSQAMEWLTRERKSEWPSKELIADIEQSGCHVVPVAHANSAWKDAEWSFSFAEAEVKLSKTLTDVQRQCYLLLKLLVEHEFMPQNLISSYCLKNLFFRYVEKVPMDYWEDKITGLGTVFLGLLDDLMYALINKNIPHYFILQNNLIEHIPQDFLDDLMKQVSKVRKRPVAHLLGFEKKFVFPYSPITCTFQDILEPLVEHCKKYDGLMEGCATAHLECLDKLLDTYPSESRLQEALVFLEQTCELLFSANINPLQCLNNKILQLRPEDAVQIYGFLLSKFLKEAGSNEAETLLCAGSK